MAFIVPFAASASTKRKSGLRMCVVSVAVCQDVEREIGAGRSKSRRCYVVYVVCDKTLSGKSGLGGRNPAQRGSEKDR